MDSLNNQTKLAMAGSAVLAAGAAIYMSMAGGATETKMVTQDGIKSEEKKKKADNFKINWTNLRDLADKYEIFLFDCDGVLWHGDE